MAATEQQGGSNVIIANISRGQIGVAVAAGFIQSLTSKTVSTILLVESGPYLDDGRNRAVANALAIDSPWEWLLFIDSDIAFHPDDITNLLRPYTEHSLDGRGYPVMGGIYYNPFDDGGVAGEDLDQGGFIGPVVYEWVERDDLPGELAGTHTPAYQRISRKALANLPILHHNGVEDVCSVACVGTGFMAIHRSLLTLMESAFHHPLPWFYEPVINGIHLGEDMGFCHRVRELGYPVLINRACVVAHHKTVKLQ